ncbi:MAG TPA: NUMOD1 domain-containing DNA-binding protein [Methanosarcina sp.]|nr:NUMOD1 domain-containing DNA-binding protein [Methanosarcina sp.]
MNYTKHYNKLIERSQNRILEGYVEKHHILPRCLGGNDDKTNIAILTPEEHFLAHQLLVKMYPGNRDLIYAVQLMTTHQTEQRINNKLFGWLRKQMAISMSAQTKKRIALNGHPKGMLGKKHTSDTNVKRAETCKKVLTELKGVPVYAYNLDGTFYKKYDSLTDCAADLKSNASNVKYTIEGRFSHCKGKQLRYSYTESVSPYVKPVHALVGRKKTEEHISNLKAALKNRPKRTLEQNAQHSKKMKEYHARKKNTK